MSGTLELLLQPGVSAALAYLTEDHETAFARSTLENIFGDHGSPVPADTVQRCIDAHFLQPYGSRLGISSYGRQTVLLLEALEGGDIEDIVRRLRRATGSLETYELVRQGMTKLFFETIAQHPGAARLFFCSPWINPRERDAAVLKYSVLESARRGARTDVVVITRPPEETPPDTRGGLQCFDELGAQVFFHPRLHSKLYIREPDVNGGLAMAIVGSENLTRSNNLELGIRIHNDGRMIDELIRYFWELTSFSIERQQRRRT